LVYVPVTIRGCYRHLGDINFVTENGGFEHIHDVTLIVISCETLM